MPERVGGERWVQIESEAASKVERWGIVRS